MNETSATSASGLSLLPDGIATLTAIHFTIIAVVAILVVIGLIWGIRAKRSRTKAAHDVIANAKEAGVVPEPVSAKPAVEARDADRAPTPRQAQNQTQEQAIAPVRVAPPPAPAEPAPPVRPAPEPAPEPAPVVRGDDVPKTPDRPTDEPIAAVSPSDVSMTADAVLSPVPSAEEAPIDTRAPVQIPAQAPAETTVQSYADDPVTQLKGLGPKVATRLGELGVTTIGQMAALTETEAQSIDTQLGNFTGRMQRDRWIEQARLLAAGDKAGFEGKFGKL